MSTISTNANGKGGMPTPESYHYDSNGNITDIDGRSLEVRDLSDWGDKHEPYFQAWVDGYQNDGLTHNDAVENALYFAQNDLRSY